MGGGQPIKNSRTRANVNIRKLRADSIYSIDEKSKIRKSHENPVVKKVYEEFLESPGSYRAEKLLHTIYEKKYKVKEQRYLRMTLLFTLFYHLVSIF